jgi:hypothetical protein
MQLSVYELSSKVTIHSMKDCEHFAQDRHLKDLTVRYGRLTGVDVVKREWYLFAR